MKMIGLIELSVEIHGRFVEINNTEMCKTAPFEEAHGADSFTTISTKHP